MYFRLPVVDLPFLNLCWLSPHTQESLPERCGCCYGLNTVRTMADLSSFSIDNNWFQWPWSQSRLEPSVGYPHEPLGHPQYPSVTQSLLVILEPFRIHFHVTMNSIIINDANRLKNFSTKDRLDLHGSMPSGNQFTISNNNLMNIDPVDRAKPK